jgi:hypothetical protein
MSYAGGTEQQKSEEYVRAAGEGDGGEEVSLSHAVIASKAKQSISPRKGRMDCFVALLLAMTVAELAV